MITTETPGFKSTPLTKAILCISVGLSIVAKLFRIEHLFAFDPSEGFDVVKIVLSSVFLEQPQAIISISLFTYWLRTLERHIGTRKSAILCVLSWLLYVALCIIELLISSIFKVKLPLIWGTHWYIYSLMMLYLHYIPEVKKTKIFNREFSSKRLMHITMVHHNIQSFPEGIAGTLAGIIAGKLYIRNFMGLDSIEVPEWIADKFSFWAIPIFGMKKCEKNNEFHDNKIEEANNVNNNIINNVIEQMRPIPYEADIPLGDQNDAAEENRDENANNNENENNDNNNNQTSNNSGFFSFLRPVEPDPQAVQTLVSMGFEEDLVRVELVRSNNNIEVAAARLLDNIH